MTDHSDHSLAATRQLIAEYRRIYLEEDDAAAAAFAEAHKDDTTFYSLVELQRQLIPAIVEAWRRRGLLLD